MSKLLEDTIASADFTLEWESENGRHIEKHHADAINFWRDRLPQGLESRIEEGSPGDVISTPLTAGGGIPVREKRKQLKIKRRQFGSPFIQEKPEPLKGRFYPKGLLKDIAGIFPQNIEPFRCVNIQNGHLEVDFNHPLAGREAVLTTEIHAFKPKTDERGGSCNDWIETIAQGPGMQARWQSVPTDFFVDNAFRREDESDDALFYETPRFVQHIDDAAVGVISDLYGKLLRENSDVLDLMSSWTSHIPKTLKLKRLSGLGMNAGELKANKNLTDFVIQDLNDTPVLPYEPDAFDAVVSTVSVEYLVQPETVFKEIARVLRPGGKAVMTFSNRWFPPKAVQIWKELHDFEKMGLVSEYFLRSGKFDNLTTFSMLGLPRPWDDKYFSENRISDPVYAVWAEKAA